VTFKRSSIAGAVVCAAGAVVLSIAAGDHARRTVAGNHNHAAPFVAFATYAAALAFGACVVVVDGVAVNRRRSR
jgi:asparagine N-glycosylation enzyme membrane subunit Stt3